MESRNARLKKALSDQRISQDKLSKRLNVSRAAVSERLNKDVEIDSIEFVNAVAELTGVDRDWLFNGESRNRSDSSDSPNREIVRVLVDQSKTQKEYIEFLKGRIVELETELKNLKEKAP